MNLKLKRTARTPYSEQITLFDADVRDENGDAVSIGKLEVHYLPDQIVGTLLIWQEYATGYARLHGPGSEDAMDVLIEQALAEVSEPLGVPAEYGIEVYYPSVSGHSFVSNYADEGEEDTEAEADAQADAQTEANESVTERYLRQAGLTGGQEAGREDDLAGWRRPGP
jgi:hypothetical protein